jgi:hypothetical protein
MQRQSYENMSYKESQFSQKDYRILYKMATPGTNLRAKLHDARFRDKRFQRKISTFEEYEVFHSPFNQLARHINVRSQAAQDILKWRLYIHK